MSPIDTITITGLRALGFHGVFPEERSAGQEFVVDVEMAVKALPTHDELDATIDYSGVADVVVATIKSGPFQLIETLANEIVTKILASEPLAESVKVTVHKPDAPLAQAFTDVAVTLTRSR